MRRLQGYIQIQENKPRFNDLNPGLETILGLGNKTQN